MWRPQGLGSLQRGERCVLLLLHYAVDMSDSETFRYCNMDYIFLSSIIGIVVLTVIASYDISCQFFTNFWFRLLALPPHLQTKLPRSRLIPKILKAHLETHGKDCHGVYSFNYTHGAGRTDGEGIERCWSRLNGSASSNKEMTPSARQETMDDFCGNHNWLKTVNLGMFPFCPSTAWFIFNILTITSRKLTPFTHAGVVEGISDPRSRLQGIRCQLTDRATERRYSMVRGGRCMGRKGSSEDTDPVRYS